MSDTKCLRCDSHVVPGNMLCRTCLDFRCTRCTRNYPHGHSSDLKEFENFDQFMVKHPSWPLIFD